jgi:hypothetical protein
MRTLLLRLLSVVILVAAPMLMASVANPVSAQGRSRVFECAGAVCEQVSGSGLVVDGVRGTATPAYDRCGVFTLTIGPSYVRRSPTICAAASRQANYYFAVGRSFSAGTLVCMTFSSRSTPGRPCLRLPLPRLA